MISLNKDLTINYDLNIKGVELGKRGARIKIPIHQNKSTNELDESRMAVHRLFGNKEGNTRRNI